ncbi:MAG: hypothetical protein CMF50_04420 [Legionellales bacterium]|nr:hypothetical protein [Legionellales bacterium]|tara:strand:+ start:765 stop:1229 length:465 start_codon:yes stop_codon:yes gene_type:complete
MAPPSNEQLSTHSEQITGQALLFDCAGTKMAVSLDKVYRVLPLVELQFVPGLASYHLGLMNFHGENISVIDLADKIYQQQASINLDTPIILCKSENNKLAFVVDSIDGIITVDLDKIRQNQQLCENSKAFMGSINRDNDIVLMLDAKMLVGEGE